MRSLRRRYFRNVRSRPARPCRSRRLSLLSFALAKARGVKPVVVSLIFTAADVLHPRLVFPVPVDRCRKSILPLHLRFPPQFRLAFCRIDRVSPVVVGPVLDKPDQVVRFIQSVENRTDDIDVVLLVSRADIVNLAGSPAFIC